MSAGEDIPSIETISAATGIKETHLREMLEGTLAPSEWHLKQLTRFLGKERAEMFDHHEAPSVNFTVTHFGRAPEGTTLMPYVRASSVMKGDLIAYNGPSYHGTHWVQVSSVECSDTMVSIELDGAVIQVAASTPVRLARRNGDNDE